MIKYFGIILTLISSFQLKAQHIESFNYSSCLSGIESCEYISPQIINTIKTENSFEVIFTAFNNCIGSFESRVNLIDQSTLNFQIVPEGVFAGDDEIEIDLCDCLFEFELKIIGINGNNIDSLTINGDSFEKHKKQFSWVEDEIKDLKIHAKLEKEALATTDSVFSFVDKPVKFLKPIDSINALINNELKKYQVNIPKTDKQLYYEIIIDRDGTVVNKKILRGIEPQIDSLVTYILNGLNLIFKPAELHNIKVKSRVVIPLTFYTKQD